MNIFGIGLPEMAVIAAIGLLVFGPKRLPELGKTLGRTLRGFQSASQEFEQEFRSAIAPGEASTPLGASAFGAAPEVSGMPVAAEPALAVEVCATPEASSPVASSSQPVETVG
jgi:sec-independent protein translocase protein TatA